MASASSSGTPVCTKVTLVPVPNRVNANVAVEDSPAGQLFARQVCTILRPGISSRWRPSAYPSYVVNRPPTRGLMLAGDPVNRACVRESMSAR
jgi:hypothetical protein